MNEEDKFVRCKEFNERSLAGDDVVFEFHGFNDDIYKCFCNFVSGDGYSFVIDDIEYLSANHYFQSQKFAESSPDFAERIRKTKDPFEASLLGKRRGHPIAKDWDSKRDEVMYKAVKAKFSQNEEIRKILLSTTKPIFCFNPEDGWWGHGVGCGGQGLNKLGKILMKVREELASETG
eukprot:TRINITY_DN5797_c0_g1_i1.p1 TRINITY_DN5797_c0_g1~~TRINITY_DN5797_c0_g1_i1.p1  ORF type:complete len:177 (-),score=40.90 TRINITY_DN5797_c0_g1_i1:67-597(-)